MIIVIKAINNNNSNSNKNSIFLQIINSPYKSRFKANLFKRIVSKQIAVRSQKSQLI